MATRRGPTTRSFGLTFALCVNGMSEDLDVANIATAKVANPTGRLHPSHAAPAGGRGEEGVCGCCIMKVLDSSDLPTRYAISRVSYPNYRVSGAVIAQ